MPPGVLARPGSEGSPAPCGKTGVKLSKWSSSSPLPLSWAGVGVEAAGAQDHSDDERSPGLVVGGCQAFPLQHGPHLGREIGIGLGRGPEDEEQVRGGERLDLAGSDPMVDHPGLVLHPAPDLAAEIVADLGRAVQDLVGEDLGRDLSP